MSDSLSKYKNALLTYEHLKHKLGNKTSVEIAKLIRDMELNILLNAIHRDHCFIQYLNAGEFTRMDLKGSSSKVRANCPFHQDKTRCAVISGKDHFDHANRFYCFVPNCVEGCRSLDLIEFVQQCKMISFSEAICDIVETLNIEIDSEDLLEAIDKYINKLKSLVKKQRILASIPQKPKDKKIEPQLEETPITINYQKNYHVILAKDRYKRIKARHFKYLKKQYKIPKRTFPTNTVSLIKEILLKYSNLTVKTYNISNEGREYITSRGIINSDNIYNLGYVDKSHNNIKTLLNDGYTMKNLYNAGLISEKSYKQSLPRDFFTNRVIFPMHDSSGDIVGFSGRSLDTYNKIKWLHSSSTNTIFRKSQILYNSFNSQKRELRKEPYEKKRIFVTESPLDALILDERGWSSVATLGAKGSLEQSNMLDEEFIKRGIKVSICYDNDAPGVVGAIDIFKKLIFKYRKRIEHLYSGCYEWDMVTFISLINLNSQENLKDIGDFVQNKYQDDIEKYQKVQNEKLSKQILNQLTYQGYLLKFLTTQPLDDNTLKNTIERCSLTSVDLNILNKSFCPEHKDPFNSVSPFLNVHLESNRDNIFFHYIRCTFLFDNKNVIRSTLLKLNKYINFDVSYFLYIVFGKIQPRKDHSEISNDHQHIKKDFISKCLQSCQIFYTTDLAEEGFLDKIFNDSNYLNQNKKQEPFSAWEMERWCNYIYVIYEVMMHKKFKLNPAIFIPLTKLAPKMHGEIDACFYSRNNPYNDFTLSRSCSPEKKLRIWDLNRLLITDYYKFLCELLDLVSESKREIELKTLMGDTTHLIPKYFTQHRLVQLSFWKSIWLKKFYKLTLNKNGIYNMKCDAACRLVNTLTNIAGSTHDEFKKGKFENLYWIQPGLERYRYLMWWKYKYVYFYFLYNSLGESNKFTSTWRSDWFSIMYTIDIVKFYT